MVMMTAWWWTAVPTVAAFPWNRWHSNPVRPLSICKPLRRRSMQACGAAVISQAGGAPEAAGAFERGRPVRRRPHSVAHRHLEALAQARQRHRERLRVPHRLGICAASRGLVSRTKNSLQQYRGNRRAFIPPGWLH